MEWEAQRCNLSSAHCSDSNTSRGRWSVMCDQQRQKYSAKAARGKGTWIFQGRWDSSWAPEGWRSCGTADLLGWGTTLGLVGAHLLKSVSIWHPGAWKPRVLNLCVEGRGISQSSGLGPLCSPRVPFLCLPSHTLEGHMFKSPTLSMKPLQWEPWSLTVDFWVMRSQVW